MFQTACTKARYFTWPVVISRRTADEQCSAGIGTFVVVNKDGWIVTAAHIIKLMSELAANESETKQAALAQDGIVLNRKERRQRRAEMNRRKSEAVLSWSAWWGKDG